MQLVSEDEEGEETLTIGSITQDASPIIKLVDSVVFNAIQRRASDIHIETQENVVIIKYRIDGVLYQAMDPIDKRHHGTIISRIKVMSELDIAEKRVPAGRPLQAARAGPHDRLPRLDHADGPRRGLGHPHPGQGVGQRRVQEPEPRGRGLRRRDQEEAPQVHPRALRHGARHRADRLGQDDDALRLPLRDPVGRGQDRHDRGPGRVPAPRDHADPGQREEGPDLRPRPAVDPPARPRQDHGRRDPRRGDGADRRAVGADRPPRLHDRPRQQRRRRARPLPQHEGRALQLRLGPELRARPAARAQDLPALQGGRDDPARVCCARRASIRSP